MLRIAALLLVTSTFATAQFARPRARKPHTGPRAIAVLENIPTQKAGQESTRYRILPVAIWYQGQYYDASIYKASPIPMALQAEVTYDVERGGEPLGTISVGLASPDPAGWRAEGELRAASSKEPEHKAVIGNITEAQGSDERPRLHRPGASASNSSTTAAPPTPAPSSSPSAISPPAPSPAAAQPQPEPAPPEDPNRPQLRRGKPTGTPAAATPGVTAKPNTAKPAGQRGPDLVGISDEQRDDPHIFKLQWAKADVERLTTTATQQAATETEKYVQQHFPQLAQAPAPRRTANQHSTKPPEKGPPAPSLENVETHAFDVDFDNDPEIVVTGRRTVANADGVTHTIFVTYVTREEGGHDWRALLAYITDDTRLDEFPRLRLVDAVDTDGDGVGKFLFRESGSVDAEEQAFRIYATGPDKLRLVFDSHGAQEQ